MTSRISYSKLGKEDRKRSLGITLVTVFFFLIKEILFVMGIQNAISDQISESYQNLLSTIIRLAQPGMSATTAVIGLAMLSAASHFYYLHSRKKEDFYESLPIKRGTFFFMQVKNSIRIFVIPLIVALLFECIVATVTGFFTAGFFQAVLTSFFSYLLIFASSWLTMALAMIMTGHIIVGLLGFGVFATYFPLVIKNIFPYFAEIFFKTYTSGSGQSLLDQLDYLSPVALGFKVTENVNWNWEHRIKYMMAVVCWIVILSLICCILYKKRPSEAAGRAMAFPKANSAIRILLVIPSALYGGFALYTMALDSYMLWMIVGILLGAVLIHGLIECIYQFDVRAFFSCKKQLGITIVAAFLILGIFWGDWFGYDRYFPKESQIQSIRIVPSSMDSGDFWGRQKGGLEGEEMKAALSIIKESAVAGKKSEKRESQSYRSYGIFKVPVPASTSESYGKNIHVTYELTGGKQISRSYELSEKFLKKLYSKVYTSKDFKKNLYSLYSVNYADITGTIWSNGIESQTLNLSQEEKKSFFDTYLSELNALTYEEASTVAPVGILTLNHKESVQTESTFENYFIYPSFKETLSFLQKKGIKTGETIQDLNITRLEVQWYNEKKGEYDSYQVKDKTQINQVKDKLICQDMRNVPVYESVNSEADVTVIYQNESGSTGEAMCFLDQETVEQLKKAAE